MKHIQYFDSPEHLFKILNSTNTQKISQMMKEYNKIRKNKCRKSIGHNLKKYFLNKFSLIYFKFFFSV